MLTNIFQVLDHICELDESCRQSVDQARHALWPEQYRQEAHRDQVRKLKVEIVCPTHLSPTTKKRLASFAK